MGPVPIELLALPVLLLLLFPLVSTFKELFKSPRDVPMSSKSKSNSASFLAILPALANAVASVLSSGIESNLVCFGLEPEPYAQFALMPVV